MMSTLKRLSARPGEPMKPFDLLIIGGGAGAFAAAIRANELGARTAMVNAGLPLGGTCVNVGCVPSKTLIHAAEILHLAKHHGIPGLELAVREFAFATVVRHELALVEQLRRKKYTRVLEELAHVTLFEGKASFTGSHEAQVNGRILQAEKFIIATGSTATVPPIEGICDVGFLTHIEALQLEQQPKGLLIVGAGPLGLEFAQLFSRFGTKVTILQRGRAIFRRTEPELTRRLAELLQQEGITIETGVTVTQARRLGGRKALTYTIGRQTREAVGDEILLAAGKTPNTPALNLGALDVATDSNGAIVVSPSLQTSQPHVFAVGDVTNLPLRQEPSAGAEGTLAAENALTGSKNAIDYKTVPYTVFTDPQLAGVGYTEEEEMAEFRACSCRTVSFADVPKAIITRRTEGLIKMVIHPRNQQILGVHLLAPHAGDLIAQAMVLVKNKNTIDDVTSSLPMFPTLAEAIKLAALSFTRDIAKLSCCT
jgi:mercuric reductase